MLHLNFILQKSITIDVTNILLLGCVIVHYFLPNRNIHTIRYSLVGFSPISPGFCFLLSRNRVQFRFLLPKMDLSSVHVPYFLASQNMIAIRSRSFFFKAENWKYSWNIVIYAVICWKNNLKLQWSDLFPISSPQNVIGDQITIIYDFQNVI